jgi:hypothetical protein
VQTGWTDFIAGTGVEFKTCAFEAMRIDERSGDIIKLIEAKK